MTNEQTRSILALQHLVANVGVKQMENTVYGALTSFMRELSETIMRECIVDAEHFNRKTLIAAFALLGYWRYIRSDMLKDASKLENFPSSKSIYCIENRKVMSILFWNQQFTKIL